MTQHLHVLNGESTLHLFEEAGIPGTPVVWNECLSEGPSGDGFKKAFWEQRAAWLEDEYGVFPGEAVEKMSGLWEAFSPEKKWDKITLWFENDLFCHINLLFALGYLQEQGVEEIDLICPSEFEGQPLRGLGHLGPEQLASLLPEARTLLPKSLDWAGEVLLAYRRGDERSLLDLREQDCGQLQLVADGLDLHFQRYPSVENGLNQIEEVLLQAVADGAQSPEEVWKVWWERDPGYGLGDLQAFDWLKGLMPALVLNLDRGLKISPKGLEVLQGKKDAWAFYKKGYWLGGKKILGRTPFRWSRKKEKLLNMGKV